jgi:hypothetical protein
MSEPKQEDVNDLLLELENIHAELKAFSERLATALSTLEWFLETSEKALGIEKQVKEKKLATPEQKFIINYLMEHLGEYKDREKLLSMSFEDAEKTIKELYEKWQNRVIERNKQIEASSKPLPAPEIKTSEGIKEAIEVKPQPVLAKPATKRQKLYIMDLAKKLNENLDLNKLSNMSAEDASVLIQQLKTKLEEKKVKGQ